MSECTRDFFILDSKVIESGDFIDSIISEGTSLYEVVRVSEGVPLFLERHLNRLKNSASIVKLELWMSEDEIKSEILKLMRANNVIEGNIKIVFNYNNSKNTSLLYFIKHYYPSEEQYERGVPTILCFLERNNPNAKIINTQLKKITDEKMKNEGAYEAILVDRNDNITEGSRSNIFMVRDNAVITAPLEGVLPGITREIIIEICKTEGIEYKEEKINYHDIDKLEGLFITGTSPKVLPISKINDFIFSSSTNIIVQNIMRAYNRIIKNYILDNSKEKI
jgi:branched-chain amino acid aminotransferase